MINRKQTVSKRGKLADYLASMKSFREEGDLNRAKQVGETALKKLASLAYSPLEKYILYHRLGVIYYLKRQYSFALDVFYKADIVASKHRLGPEYLASASYMLAMNYLGLSNFRLALRRCQTVEQYYQKYGYKRPIMNLSTHIMLLIGEGHCYLHLHNFEKVREIIEQKLPQHQSVFNKEILIDYHHLKGEYLMRIKDYPKARLSFQETLRLTSENQNDFGIVLSTKLGLAALNIAEGQPGSAITLLKTILKETARIKDDPKYNFILCENLLLLSKCYALIGLQDKADALEKRLKVRLKELDIAWFYALSKEVDDICRQMESLPATLKNRVSLEPALAMLSRTREHLSGRMSSYKPDSETEEYAIIGKSSVMQEMYQLIEKVAPTDLPVLIYGETGTGKELAARAVHQRSLRSRQMWLACNAGAIPETLLESELFGYVRGAFTGAQTDKKGYIELASNGTLFLDEVGNMSLGMQQKLLRVMEDNLLWRVGAEKPVPVNTRFVFASNEDLEALVKTKRFREDLFYRINTIIIALPPLRERPEDIPLLVQYFLKKYTGRFDSFQIPDSAFSILTAYHWPGNVRELENEIKRICVLHPQTETIDESMLTESIRNARPFSQPVQTVPPPETGMAPGESVPVITPDLIEKKTLAELTDSFQKNIIITALQKYRGNISRTSRALGCDRAHLYERLKRWGINLADFNTSKE